MNRMFFDQSNISEPDYGGGDDARSLAEDVVYAYTVEELEERIPKWLDHDGNLSWVHDEWWTQVNESMTDEQMDKDWERMVADGSVKRLTLAYLIARQGNVWTSFLDFYADDEEASYESLH